nr:four-carbon acid sugar kinase family protein [Jiangella mangrovi]
MADQIAERLLQSIIDQEFPPGSSLPAEAELAERFGASRLTVREAIRALRTQNVVRIQRGRGTLVNTPEQWTSLTALVQAANGATTATGATGQAAERLLEARRMIEVGAAQLAADRRDDADLARLAEHIDGMRRAAAAGDVERFVADDIAFHDVIMQASGNLFVPALFGTFGPLLIEARRQTSAVPEIRVNAIGHHVEILAALTGHDPEAARAAMERHMDQTLRDLRTHVTRTPGRDPADVLAPFPPVRPADLVLLRDRVRHGRTVVVLDDDPTGTQAVADVPVLSSWSADDVRWALRQSAGGFFVLTNTRSLSPDDAAAVTREVVDVCLEVARADGVDVAFASRSDSTLRGHFPLEPDVIAERSAAAGRPVDAVLVVPAYVDAGRLTAGSVHWVRQGDQLVPAARTEFAADATFGYRESDLRRWVEEKTGGRIAASAVPAVTLTDLRDGGPEAVAKQLAGLTGGRVVVVDAATDDDLRLLALAVLEAEAAGKRFVYRVGPSFVRARLGQEATAPLTASRLAPLLSGAAGDDGGHGLVVVGSHTAVTTRQLDRLRERLPVTALELDVAALRDRDAGTAGRHVAAVADRVAAALRTGTVVVSTSRAVVTGADGAASLALARTVSASVVDLVRRVTERTRPAFVVAKGGITSHDVATKALRIGRARAAGTLLPGIVSLWEPLDGPARGVPYVVFAGNVGDDDSLAAVVTALTEAPHQER